MSARTELAHLFMTGKVAACRLAEALAIRNECPAYNVDNNTLEVEA